MTARWPGWALALAGHPAEALRSTPTVAAYLLTGTVVFAVRPRNPVARWLLVFAGLEAAGFAIGSAYSASLVKEGTPAWGWPVILALQAVEFATFVVIFMVCALFPDGKYQRPYERRMAAIWGAAVPLLIVMQLLGSARLEYSGSFSWQDSVRQHVAQTLRTAIG